MPTVLNKVPSISTPKEARRITSCGAGLGYNLLGSNILTRLRSLNDQQNEDNVMNMKKNIACCAALVAVLMTLAFPKARAASDDDKTFLATAAQLDQSEIGLSKLAGQKATNPDVKAFAQKMVSEHEKMSASMKPFADSWSVIPPSGLDEEHQKVDKLQGMFGNDFDKDYMSQMVTDHAKALDAFITEAKDTKDVKFRSAVLKGKTVVAAHKNMAYDLNKKLKHTHEL